VLNVRKRVLGNDHLDTRSSMGYVALDLQGQNDKYTDAQALIEQALSNISEVLEGKLPVTLSRMHDLAMIARNHGEYLEKAGLLREVLRGQEKVLGKTHPHTLRSAIDLAWMLTVRKKYDEAHLMCRRAVTILEIMLGKDHPHTVYSARTLAGIIKRWGVRFYESPEEDLTGSVAVAFNGEVIDLSPNQIAPLDKTGISDYDLFYAVSNLYGDQLD